MGLTGIGWVMSLALLLPAAGAGVGLDDLETDDDLVIDTDTLMIFGDGAGCSFEVIDEHSLHVVCQDFSLRDCQALAAMGSRLSQTTTQVNHASPPSVVVLAQASCERGDDNQVVYQVDHANETHPAPPRLLWE